MTDRRVDQVVPEEPAYVAPRNPVETAVAEIWAELLEVSLVGIHDNFLLLGGESLLAMQAAARLRGQFGCEITLRSILVNTVAEIAAEITSSQSAL